MTHTEHRDFRLQSNGVDEAFVVATTGTLADQNAWIQIEHKDGELVVVAFSRNGAHEGVELGKIDKDGALVFSSK